MRKVRRKSNKKLSVGISTACLIAACCLALLLTPVFNIRAVTVTGNKTLSTEDIVRASGITVGGSIFSVNMGEVRDRISQLSGIDTVKVRRSLPSTVRITVTEGKPLVYVLNEARSELAGITVYGKVVEVIPVSEEYAQEPETETLTDGDADLGAEAPETGAPTTDAPETEAPEAPTDGEDEDSAPALAGRTIVTGMGEMKYGIGKEIQFTDEKKGGDLAELMDKFLSDDRNFTQVDMSAYDSITLIYKDRLKVKLGPAAELEYKMKLFRKIVDENLGENPSGTLDLQRQTYSPEK